MGTRVPVVQQDQQQHYTAALRAAGSSYMAAAAASSLHDLNTVETRAGGADIDAISSDVDRDALTDDTLDNGDDSNSVDCIHESYRSSMSIHGVGVDEDRSSLENSTRSSSPPYNILMVDDVSPIETARARFLQIFVDHFINDHVIEVPDYSNTDYCHGHDKLSKRKPREIQYEGDPRFVLPLMYVANLYETLVGNVNMRLGSLAGVREKTIGVALEAAGGLYRRLAKKFPRKGPCSFKRRELATSLETRTKFPELVVQDEKRVRFVVVNGLVIVEKPSDMLLEDAEWFKRLTGRHEVAVCARDYKFYSPRHKYRRVSSHHVSSVSTMSAFPGADSSPPPCATGFRPVNENQQQSPSRHHMPQVSHQSQYHSLAHNQSMQQNPHHQSQFSCVHPCTHCTHIPEITHQHTTPSIAQSIACLQTLSGGQIGGRSHLLPTSPAKFCDECGTPYWRETSKFCSECGTKRPGI